MSERSWLLEALRRYGDRYPEEAETVERFITFVAGHADCFERTLQIGHVTGSAWLVDATGEKVLLTHHRKLDRWFQLGGHADGESDVLKVALREALEESGLETVEPHSRDLFDIDIHRIPQRGFEPAHWHYDIRFALICRGSEAYTVGEESHDLRWIAVSAVQELSNEESMLRMAHKWLAARQG